MTPISKASEAIKKEAKRLGFGFCGISKAEFLEREASRLDDWLNKNYHGEMEYLSRNFDKRLDPRKLVDGAKSVISLTYSYYPEEKPIHSDAPKIARYAYGEDYHVVMKDKIYLLLSFIEESFGEVHGRVFVDSAPVMEKAWAERSGLGWIGKNTNLINQNAGSYFFLGEIILDMDLIPGLPVADHCGTCTRCIDACPTGAITEAYLLNASKCISYLTIELKSEIPKDFQPNLENWAFGCDICQEVCPWNRFSVPQKDSLLDPSRELLEMNKKDWQEITEDVFNKLFARSALERAGFKKIKQTLEYLKK
jgi:epoxyqueuosine reductase